MVRESGTDREIRRQGTSLQGLQVPHRRLALPRGLLKGFVLGAGSLVTFVPVNFGGLFLRRTTAVPSPASGSARWPAVPSPGISPVRTVGGVARGPRLAG